MARGIVTVDNFENVSFYFKASCGSKSQSNRICVD